MTIIDIHRWLEDHLPSDLSWNDAEFKCIESIPFELRMFLSMDNLESQVRDGGLPQFLWNSYYHWRLVIDDCERAYRLIGASAQSSTASRFRRLLSDHEQLCFTRISQCAQTKDFGVFGSWCKETRHSLVDKSEELIADLEGELPRLRTAWIDVNAEMLRRLMLAHS